MHLLLPALIRLFKVDASVDIRRAAIKTLTKLIPRVQVVITPCVPFLSKKNIIQFYLESWLWCVIFLFQVTGHISSLVHHLKLVLDGSVSFSLALNSICYFTFASPCPSCLAIWFDLLVQMLVFLDLGQKLSSAGN